MCGGFLGVADVTAFCIEYDYVAFSAESGQSAGGLFLTLWSDQSAGNFQIRDAGTRD